MKTIAIDYDDTYTADEDLFESFIATAKAKGHVVVFVTYRNKDTHPITGIKHEIFYTAGQQKAEFMRNAGLEIDIWVDDWPELIGNTR